MLGERLVLDADVAIRLLHISLQHLLGHTFRMPFPLEDGGVILLHVHRALRAIGVEFLKHGQGLLRRAYVV